MAPDLPSPKAPVPVRALHPSSFPPLPLLSALTAAQGVAVRQGILAFAAASLGLFLILRVRPFLARARAVRQRPTTSGNIVKSLICQLTDPEGRDHFSPEIRYAYEVDGQKYIGFYVGIFDHALGDLRTTAAAVVTRYPLGRTVTVYYDPVYPNRAVLEPQAGALEITQAAAGWLLLAASLALSGLIFYQRPAWAVRRPEATPIPAAPAATPVGGLRFRTGGQLR